jgi:xanthine dehydrogenase molybdopterin-binding subunit B
MPVQRTQLPRLWTQVQQLADWNARQASVRAHNAAHRWRKRGAALLPVKFGIAFGANFLNQGGALVHVCVASHHRVWIGCMWQQQSSRGLLHRRWRVLL